MRRRLKFSCLLYMSLRAGLTSSYQGCVRSGDCDSYNSSVDCGDDGGDCCGCNNATVSSTSASAYPVYNCSADAPCACNVIAPCSTDPDPIWEVNDEASAKALVEAVRCSGGVFNVQWRGSLALEETICVASGTFLNLTGAGEEAVVQGVGDHRLFTVVNASLLIRNLTVSNGFAPNGGAVYATRSNLSFYSTSFVDNNAVATGGALHVVDGSTVIWSGGALFGNNNAHESGRGGAVFINDSSSVSCSGTTEFSNNTIYSSYDSEGRGGAVYIGVDSSVSCSGNVRFSNNQVAYGGGAVCLDEGAKLVLSESSRFDYNHADDRGGAVYVDGSSAQLSFSGNTSFDNNHAGHTGGAVCVEGGFASLSLSGSTIFDHNEADRSGGAVYVLGSSGRLSFSGTTNFHNNSCVLNGGAVYAYSDQQLLFSGGANFSFNSAKYNGGAVYISSGGSLSFDGKTSFGHNQAFKYHGGAVFSDRSRSFWAAAASFNNNFAGDNGGAVKMGGGSIASWEAEAEFMNNYATTRGGALYLEDESKAYWNATTTFSDNEARLDGGALALVKSSAAQWGAVTNVSDGRNDTLGSRSTMGDFNVFQGQTTKFFRNTVTSNGGAVLLEEGSETSWMTPVIFSQNSAKASGGAVYLSSGASILLDSEASFIDNAASGYAGGLYVSEGKLSMNGDTLFVGNECKGSGGGMVISSDSTLTLGTENITFNDNSALVFGGAVHISSVQVGPQLVGFTFISNSAQVGGAVYITGGGTLIRGNNRDEMLVAHPTVLDRCTFVDNTATASGGAVVSVSGRDLINNTYFERNSAEVGGALRLAGTASVHNCTFVDNTSEEDEGPAISNVGFISGTSRLSFSNNVFACKPGTYLSYEEPEASLALFDVVCQGCDTECVACDVPGAIPSCVDQLAHTMSTGGNVTIEHLTIEPGYWRATNRSEEVMACFNEEACLGGVTREEGNCHVGYEGPYCSVCSDGYTKSIGFTCEKCYDDTVGFTVASIVGVFAVLASLAILIFMVFGNDNNKSGGRRRRMFSWTRLFHSLKIVIVVWQILTQFASVANIVYPDVYQRFLDGINLLNFDINWIPSTGCIFSLGFHDRLIIATTFPILCLAILGLTFVFARSTTRGSEDALQRVRCKHLSMVLLLTFLVYSPVSSILFQMFSCDDLDDHKTYLRADYRIECNSSKHEALQVYAVLMMILYTAGIPAFFGTILFHNREVLKNGEAREEDAAAKSISNLWDLYKPSRIYYELVECARRVLLAGVVAFIYPNTAAQVAVALVMGGFFMLLSEALSPYASHLDAWISRTGHAIVCSSMFLALLLKVDVADERAGSQHVFESILVSAHVCMVLAVVGEAVVVTCRSLSETNREESIPRFLEA